MHACASQPLVCYSQLQALAVFGCAVSGTLGRISQMQSLTTVHVMGEAVNKAMPNPPISGTIHPEMFGESNPLRSAVIWNIGISGSIPLVRSVHLQTLQFIKDNPLSSNPLSGTLALGDLPNLTKLEVTTRAKVNGVSGTLPPDIMSLPNLVRLILSRCELSNSSGVDCLEVFVWQVRYPVAYLPCMKSMQSSPSQFPIAQ